MSDNDYLQTALAVARRESQDPWTQTGAVLLIGDRQYEAANRVPGGIELPDYILQSNLKYDYIEHAERAVIFQAASGVFEAEDFARATLYAPWFACSDCARAIVGVGIREVVGLASLRAMTPPRWERSVRAGEKILERGGVSMRWICGMVGEKITFNGKEMLL
jgi:deoxycytidylate deaminase